MKYIIKKVKEKMPNGYIGQNYYSAKHFNLKNYPKKKNVIQVWGGQNKKTMKHTIKHEKIESELMKRGHQYRVAHKLALKYEASKLPIKKILKVKI